LSDKESASLGEFRAQGVLTEKGVKVVERSSVDALSQRGYGTVEKTSLLLAYYEALYLLDKQVLSIQNKDIKQMNFQSLLQAYETSDDLRGRGYVVREGFGATIDFRIYERGAYGKDAASSLVLSTQEGKPMPIDELTRVLAQTQSLKKELVLAVMNRRGEIVYYSVSPLTFK
jgi:tRNA-intron endonuclease